MPHDKKGGADTLADFIKYNNAVPVALGVLCFLTTGAAAASPEVRDAVYASKSVVVSADTTYLESVNLDKYPFSMRVTGIAEDADYVYVSYEFLTIEAIDSIWKSSTRKDTLRVSKALLRDGDLKKYVESEFAQVRWHEIDTLSKLQADVRREGGTQKVVVTTHSGLVGNLLKPTEEEVPQYHSEASPEDPLYVDNPRPLVTWDENKQGSEASGTESGDVVHTTGTVIIGPDGSVSTSTETTDESATTTESASVVPPTPPESPTSEEVPSAPEVPAP